jgi:hypothetical protein
MENRKIYGVEAIRMGRIKIFPSVKAKQIYYNFPKLG